VINLQEGDHFRLNMKKLTISVLSPHRGMDVLADVVLKSKVADDAAKTRSRCSYMKEVLRPLPIRVGRGDQPDERIDPPCAFWHVNSFPSDLKPVAAGRSSRRR
jgi:hypothetical protein